MAGAFRWLHRRRLRLSPLHERKIGHLPGQQLLERIAKHDEEVSFGIDMMVIAMPLLFMVWEMYRIDWERIAFGVSEAIFLVARPLFFVFGFCQYRRYYRLREQARGACWLSV